MVLPILLVDPTICFICTKADKSGQRRYFLPPLLGLSQASPSSLQLRRGKAISSCCLQPVADELIKKKKENKHHHSFSASVHWSRRGCPHTCTYMWSELCPLCKTGKVLNQILLVNRTKSRLCPRFTRPIISIPGSQSAAYCNTRQDTDTVLLHKKEKQVNKPKI